MATSPIYNWPEPDNTDLVKNGALAIRTMGNAIDTTMATMVAKTIVDAKGDLIAGTAADTAARLAVGANGETLVADSSTATGLRYQSNFAAGKNKIINGAFDNWQRGTSFALTNEAYTSDRFKTQTDKTGTISRQTFTPGAAPVAGVEGQYFLRSALNAVGSYYLLNQPIENVQTFAGQTITLSFYARVSSGTATNAPEIIQNFGSGGSASVTTTPSGQTITTDWQRFSASVAIPSISGKTIGTGSALEFRVIRFVSASAATIDIWGVQVEAGSVATAFQTATGSIQGELAACQRYYQKSFPQTTAPASNTGRTGAIENYAIQTAGAFALSFVRLSVNMRSAPTVTVYNPSAANNQPRNNTLGSDCSGNTVEGQTDNSFRYFYLLPTSTVSTNVIISHYEATAEL